MPLLPIQNTKRLASNRLLILLITVTVLTFSVEAQKFRSSSAGIGVLAPAAAAATQCHDGALATPVPCSGANYKSGALVKSSSHYFEGDSIPYQIGVSAPAGSSATVTLTWESTKGGIHAIDYLTSFDRTESIGNDPCTGTAADCSVANKSTFAIPLDLVNVPKQLTGQVFTMWGAHIDSVSPTYTVSGSFAGDSTTSITINFTMGPNAAVAILAVGGHASTRLDWGAGFASVNIQGSPFHFIAGNNLAVNVGTLTAAAGIQIVQLLHNSDGTNFSPTATIPYTSTGGPLPATFSLGDTDPTFAGGGVQSAPTDVLGTAFTVTQNLPSPVNGYSFTQVLCAVAGGGFPIASTATANQATRTVTITPAEGNVITCTFENAGGAPTAARVTLGGRVTAFDGSALAGVRVSLTDAEGTIRTAITNRFGYYTFTEVEVGRAYVLGAAAKRYSFDSKLITLNDSVSNMNLLAN